MATFPPLHATRSLDRRSFLNTVGIGMAAVGVSRAAGAAAVPSPSDVEGFAEENDKDASKGWQPFSDRKLRVGLVGYGFSHFSAVFGFQDHPNVEVVAVSDLFPDRCSELAKITR